MRPLAAGEIETRNGDAARGRALTGVAVLLALLLGPATFICVALYLLINVPTRRG